MPTVSWRRVAGFVSVCALALSMAAHASGQAGAPDKGTIRGVVLDRADGSPIADVSVKLQDEDIAVKTDDAGRFEMAGVRPGRRVVYVSLVGFILVKRTVELAPGGTLDLTIAPRRAPERTARPSTSRASGSQNRKSPSPRSRP